MPIKNIKFSKQDIKDLGELFGHRIEAVRSDRDELMQKTWKLALENYEGKTPPIDWPWPNASNAHVPVTGTHCDAFQARFFNAATAHDQIFLILPKAANDLKPLGVESNAFADAMVKISQHIESSELNLKDVMEEVTTIFIKYGDAFVSVGWEHQQIVDMDFDPEGNPVASEPRDILDKPVLRVIHPRNFYMPLADRNIQMTPWVGVDEDYDLEEVREKGESGEWYKPQVDALLESLGERTIKAQKRRAKEEGHYRSMGDGRIMHKDEWELEQDRILKANNVENDPGRVRLTRIWCRLDTDKDGIKEDVILVIHPESKTVLQARWNTALHRSRALVHYYFVMREGTWLSIGAAELLFNIQKILNDVMRDMLNNNQIRNTSVFIAKAGGSVTQKTAIYPSRLLFFNDPKNDFQVMNLGSGQMSVSVNDLSMLQSWAERRTGISDFNLGRERTSRTPAATLHALLEEGNERMVRIVDRMKESMADVWRLVLALYIQKGADDIINSVLTEEEAIMVRTVWDAMTPREIMNNLIITPQVSTKTFNRAVQRQESLALFGQMEELYKRLFSISQAYKTTQDPQMQKLLIGMAKGLHTLMRRALITYGEVDHRDLNPDISEDLQGMAPVMPGGIESVQQNPFTDQPGGSTQSQQAAGILGNQGTPGNEGNVPGRPTPGQNRIPGA